MKKVLISTSALILLFLASCSTKDSGNSTPAPKVVTKNNSWCKITKETDTYLGTPSVIVSTWNGNTCTVKDDLGTVLEIVTYNDYGKKIKDIQNNSDGSFWYSVSYEYTDCANWCKMSKSTDNTTSTPIVSTFTWNGNTCTEKDASGKIENVTIYNDYGKELSVTSYNGNGTIASTTTYEYTDCLNWCKITKQSVTQNGSTTVQINTWNGNTQTSKDGSGLLKSKITYNDYGMPLVQTIYNPDGSVAFTDTSEYTDCKN